MTAPATAKTEEDQLQDYTDAVLKETREELVRADTKASLLFAASGVVLAAVLAGIINGEWTPGDLEAWATWVFAGGATAYAAAVVALGVAVWPRIQHEEPTRAADYFGDIVNYKGEEKRPALREALRRGAANTERSTSQLVIISGIVWTKYRGIQVAVACFGVSLAACATAVLLG